MVTVKKSGQGGVCHRTARGGWASACGCPLLCHPPPLHPLYPTPPACNVTIHNRCKDTLANCTKVKQKVRWHGGQRAGGEGSEWAAPQAFSSHALPCVPHPLSALRGSQTLSPRPQAPRGPAYCWLTLGFASLVPLTAVQLSPEGAGHPASALWE